MPPKTRAARARISLPLPEPKKKTRDDTTQTRRSRPLKQWRTSGIVDKQSTLTQIDFVRPANGHNDGDLDLDYEDEDTIQLDDIIPEPRPKRRKIDTTNRSSTNDRRKSTVAISTTATVDNKENEVLGVYKDDGIALESVILTPRKPRAREVLSSQSPTTPLSVRSTRKRLIRMDGSPLKDLSVNIPHLPRLYVEDTYKTLDTESTLSRAGSTSSEARPLAPIKKSSHDKDGTRHDKTESIQKLEILDSDEELSDTEIARSPQNGELPVDLEGSSLLQSSPTRDTNTNLGPSESETEIYKLPISDDSKDGEQDYTSVEEILSKEYIDQEANTLDDTLLLKSRRTYSGSRRRSIMEQIPSSSILEELSGVDEMSPSSHTSPGRTIQISSSPPRALLNEQSQHRNSSEGKTGSGQDYVSEAVCSDSQQATVQLQQESHQQPRVIVPSSQASTASIPSSPVIEEAKAMQSGSNRRGWFFNPLTDSQLLPDSIMNFELPRFPRMLGLGHAAPGEENGEEE